LWQFSDYLVRERWRNLVWGALATAMAFSAKGQLGVVLVGLPVLAQLWHTRKWYLLFRWPALLGLGVFALGISPVLYAYYLQFDLHPELVIRGIDQRSGVFFILWEQSFERMSGTGMGSNSPDYLFFFHTFLWVFLPWTLVGVYAWVDRWRRISSARSFPESMTFIGVTAIMVLISFAQFKLPHYLNGTLPIWAVLSAPYLSVLSSKKPWVIAQKTLLTAVLICSGVLVWAFGTGSELGVWVALVGVVALPRLWRSSTGMIWRYTALIFGGLYLMMHLFFYPNLLAYQSGVSLAKAWHKDRATGKEAPIYKLSDQFTWSLDFYTHQPLVLIDSTQISTISQGWLYTEIDPNILLKDTNRNWTLVEKSPHFRITRLNWSFLNPQTRTNQLSYRYLIWLSADR
jgi:4-amino-4-deoxy-L-arabinose transferase-like glycosyltransferase